MVESWGRGMGFTVHRLGEPRLQVQWIKRFESELLENDAIVDEICLPAIK